MAYLDKGQTECIRKDIGLRGIVLPDLKEDLLDYLCSAVEQEMERQPDFETAYHNVLQTLKPNELKMTQQKTQELLDNKVSLLQKATYSVLLVLLLSITGYLISLPWTGEIIGISILSLIALYIYSNVRWYFNQDGNSRSEKGYILLALFIVFLFILSIIFKLFHWPGAGILLVCSLGILIFLPVLMSIRFYIKGEEAASHIIMGIIKNNQQKVEFILLAIFLLGFTARLLIIDFLGNMFIITTLFCFSFLFIGSTWPVLTSALDKKWHLLLLLTSTVAYCCAIVTGLFKIMHWPFPFINFYLNLPYMTLGLMACIWYGLKAYKNKDINNIILFVLSSILFIYALLLFRRISPYPVLEHLVYNVPVLILFIITLFIFYKNRLFRVVAIVLLGYYLLSFPYRQMPNKSLNYIVYQDDKAFLDLYQRSYQNPQNEDYLKQLIEYNYNKTISQK